MVDLPTLRLDSEPSTLARPIPLAHPASTGLGDIAGGIWRRKLLAATVFVLVFAPMAAIVLSLPSRFTSTALILADPKKPNLTDLQTVINPGTPNEDVLSTVRSDVQILESDGLAHRVIEKLHLENQPGFVPKASPLFGLRALITRRLGLPEPAPAPDAAFVQYQKSFSAINDGKSYIISASFSDADPAQAQRVLATHLAAYLDDQRASKKVVIGRAEVWLDGQLAELSDKISASERRLQELVNSNHLGQAEGATVGSRELAGTATQLNEARADLARKRARARQLAELARSSSYAAATSSDVLASPLIQKLREQETGLAAEATQLSERFGAQHPTVLAARAGLANVEQEIRAEISRLAAAAANEVAVASATVASASEAEAEAERHVASENSAGVAINQIQRDLDADRKLYADLLARSKQLAIQREIQEPDAQIVSSPDMPLRPSSPHRGLLLLMSAGTAALLASVAALVRERLDDRSQSLSDIEALCGLNGLGVIPQVKRGILRRREALLGRMSPLSPLAAAVQTVRNSIAFSDHGHPPAVIAFGSALPGEGKTTLVTCYGYSLAQAGRRVLLIDADLRRPGLTWLLTSRPHSGIVDVLEGRQALHDAVVSVPRFGFDVLAVERAAANPHDLLQNPGLRDLLNKARAVYDVVLIDTPPVSVVDDALAVMRSCDVTALVVRWGRTPYEAVRATGRRLGFAKVKIAGVVLNAVALRRYHANSHDLESYRPSSGRYYLQ